MYEYDNISNNTKNLAEQSMGYSQKTKKRIRILIICVVVVTSLILYSSTRETRLTNLSKNISSLYESKIPDGLTKKSDYDCDIQIIRKGGSDSCSSEIRYYAYSNNSIANENGLYSPEALEEIQNILKEDGWSNQGSRNPATGFSFEKSFLPAVNCMVSGTTSDVYVWPGDSERSERKSPASFSVYVFCKEDTLLFGL